MSFTTRNPGRDNQFPMKIKGHSQPGIGGKTGQPEVDGDGSIYFIFILFLILAISLFELVIKHLVLDFIWNIGN